MFLDAAFKLELIAGTISVKLNTNKNVDLKTLLEKYHHIKPVDLFKGRTSAAEQINHKRKTELSIYIA